MRHIALLVEYDGARYHGFQVQHNAATVQQALERALEDLLGAPTPLRGASRTDVGVHARGQVASFRTDAQYPAETFVLALNSYLPEDIAVQAVCDIGADVDVRRYAYSRRYRYSILNCAIRSPLARAQALLVREPLDVDAMDWAAQALVGQHGFASFSGQPSYPGQPSERRVLSATVHRSDAMVYFDIEAESFLPQQVRRTVAQLLYVGKHKRDASVIQAFLDHPVLGAAWEALPPHALCLEAITYPDSLVPFADGAAATHTPARAMAVLSGV